MPSLLVVIAVLVALWLLSRRANELCAVRIADGNATLLRGRAPARFLADAREIAARALEGPIVVAVVNEGGSPRVVLRTGVASETVLQQLRNVAGQHQVLHFRGGVRAR